MSSLTLYRLNLGVYWLFLGIWAGSIVMLAVSAAITFRTVRDMQPSIGKPPYNDPALADRAAPILAGAVVGNSLHGLRAIQFICAVAVAICVILQCWVFAERLAGGVAGWVNLLRILVLAVPLLILAADQFVVTPRVWAQRVAMYDAGQSEEARREARGRFDRYHKLNERMVSAGLLFLAAAALLSPFVLYGERR